MIRRLLFLLFLCVGSAIAETEQPPFESQDAATTENFRNIYYRADKLSLLTSLFTYTLDTSSNTFCIDSPTFCIDANNNRIGIGTTSSDRTIYIKDTNADGRGIKLESAFAGTLHGSSGGSIGPANLVGYWNKPTSTVPGDYMVLANVGMNTASGAETEFGEIGANVVSPSASTSTSRMLFSVLGYGRTFLDGQVAFSITPTTNPTAGTVGSTLRWGIGEALTSTGPITGGGYLHSDESAAATLTSGAQPIGGNRYISRAGEPSFATILKLGTGSTPGTFEVFLTTSQTLGAQYSVPTSSSQYVFTTSSVTTTVPVVLSNGSASRPALSFTNSSSLGLFSSAAASMRFVSGGTSKASVIATGFEISSGTLYIQDGSVSAPALTFTDSGNQTDGLYRTGTHAYAWAANGAQVWATSSAGEITQPLQPSFLTHLNSAQNNVTGDGTQFTIPYNNEIYDQGSDFSGSTFTAPIGGRYLLTVHLKLEGIATTHTSLDAFLVTSNRTYFVTYSLPGSAAVTEWTVPMSVIADMDANDTSRVDIVVNGTGKTADVSGAASHRNVFSGSLIN